MKITFALLSGLVASTAAVALPPVKRGSAVSVTPHDMYSSSVGVLGCKINTNRVAYWPSDPSCDNLCVRVDANGRSVYLLKIDKSGGAFDISYDAWNYLDIGKPATEDPQQGGGIAATYEDVDMSLCADLIKPEANGKLAFSAANSIDFIVSCPASSWVGQNSALYNIANPTCNWGIDEVCHLDLAKSNQPFCPSGQLGNQSPLTSDPVWNILYGTGETALAV